MLLSTPPDINSILILCFFLRLSCLFTLLIYFPYSMCYVFYCVYVEFTAKNSVECCLPLWIIIDRMSSNWQSQIGQMQGEDDQRNCDCCCCCCDCAFATNVAPLKNPIGIFFLLLLLLVVVAIVARVTVAVAVGGGGVTVCDGGVIAVSVVVVVVVLLLLIHTFLFLFLFLVHVILFRCLMNVEGS